jgi:hypothetical protein
MVSPHRGKFLLFAELTSIRPEIGAYPHDVIIFLAAERRQELKTSQKGRPQLSSGSSVVKTVSPFPRLMSRTLRMAIQ